MNDALATVFASPTSTRQNPADTVDNPPLSDAERRNSIGCMRVNHTGEVCAQALYRGQLSVCRSEKTKIMLEKSCAEEEDHLAWTQKRVEELSGKTSYLNFFWYMNSYFIGLAAGLAGDRWSLGFVEETEIQVARHLEKHLDKLAGNDYKSRAIVEKMREEEMQHEKAAHAAGAAELPFIIKCIMQAHSKVMTMTSYWV